MIDDKKIEEAKDNIFNKYFLKNNEGMICVDHISEPIYLDYQIKQAIELGAKWAINEFLKDLQHPASEEPKENFDLVYINNTKEFREISSYNSDRFDDLFGKGWEAACRMFGIYKWAYKDDLFPKEGGKQ